MAIYYCKYFINKKKSCKMEDFTFLFTLTNKGISHEIALYLKQVTLTEKMLIISSNCGLVKWDVRWLGTVKEFSNNVISL